MGAILRRRQGRTAGRLCGLDQSPRLGPSLEIGRPVLDLFTLGGVPQRREDLHLGAEGAAVRTRQNSRAGTGDRGPEPALRLDAWSPRKDGPPRRGRGGERPPRGLRDGLSPDGRVGESGSARGAAVAPRGVRTEKEGARFRASYPRGPTGRSARGDVSVRANDDSLGRRAEQDRRPGATGADRDGGPGVVYRRGRPLRGTLRRACPLHGVTRGSTWVQRDPINRPSDRGCSASCR